MITVPCRGNFEVCLRELKRALQYDQVFRRVKMKGAYESPSEKKARKMQESRRRRCKHTQRRKSAD